MSDPTTEAAARTLIAQRCQRAYVHEIRGGLQALSGAFELLSRLAKNGDGDPAVADRAATLAKRALTNHENAMLDIVRQITAARDPAERVELRAMLDDVLHFLHNDFEARQIQTRVERGAPLFIEVPRNQLRFMLFGLLTDRLDRCAASSEVTISLAARDGGVVLDLQCASGETGSNPVLDLVERWVEAQGGRFERVGDRPGRLALVLPEASTTPA
ncbi:MAG TPA: hypothetical protein VKT22_13390 [Steroidobacteraceae bacterium]|nr:hypothetical protein [Steroidobacteraceae bacterium]